MAEKIPPRQVHREIREQIKKNVNLEAKVWQENKGPVNQKGRSLSNLYHLARRNVIGGKSFFGHGDWYTYLEKHHKIMPINYPQLRKWASGKLKPSQELKGMTADSLLDYTDSLAEKFRKKKGWRLSSFATTILPTVKAQVAESGKVDYKALQQEHGGELRDYYVMVRNLRTGGHLQEAQKPFERDKVKPVVERLLQFHKNGRIDERQAVAVVLLDLYDLTKPQASKALGISKPTMEIVESQARKIVKNKLILAKHSQDD